MKKPFESYESGDYLINNPTWDIEDSPWKASKVMEAIRRNGLLPGKIAEVGCGAGGVLAAMNMELPHVEYFGFDIAPDASRFWDEHKRENISFEVNDFLKVKTGRFDVLLLLDVIEHLPNPFDFLAALRGRADYYIFHIPLDLSALSVLRESPLLKVRRKVGHIHYFTKGLAVSLIEECGFEIVDYFYTGASLNAHQAGWKTKLAKLPRYIIYALNHDIGARLLGGDTLMVVARAPQE